MVMILLDMINLRWSVTTVISWDTLPGNAKHQEARKVLIGSGLAEEQVQTNMALMAFSDSEVYTDKTCSKTCLKNYETLKKQYDDLLAKLHQTEFKASTYKRGLDTVEVQLVTYRKNEVLFGEEDVVLKREVGCKQYEINMLKTEFEKVKQEKDGIDFKIKKFDKASKDLDQLKIQVCDGLGSHKKMIWRILPNRGGKMLKLMKITLVQMDAQTQGRHEHNQEFDAEITIVGVEVDDIAAET
ncbi:hypothetical protein Tco_0367835 [Tanacetum coccineum]